ncbi:MAG TPA: TlpA disulfide reductase family protein [Pyrinomonadaceae bacterium]|nr:TlpA family protein disulfide reductase [Chloracidobacterium sp.]HBE82937.1 hypothetical protein [Blastocatellia bacterium]HRJ87382.1 TlpA disulfide reductase family protein [Pyrinomonadaceae bacterium]HRK49883.1 TlpA disulfide reductase family protein [Pyrinomonadaceae bacterium]
MFKKVVLQVSLFAVLSVVLSSFSGCASLPSSDTTRSDSNGTDKTPTGSAPGSSGFPPLAEKAAQAEMRHLDGSTSRVADRKGRVVLLNLWATWCKPCLAEVPALVKLQEKYRDRGFEIIGLNTDDGDTKEMIDDFAARLNVNYPLVWASTEMQSTLIRVSKFEGIPQSFLVDRDGRLRGVFRGANPAEIKKMENTVARIVSE